MAINLPPFNPSKSQREWIRRELQTARFIKALWNAANNKQRRDPKFIALLVCCGWTNAHGRGKGWESTRLWRNEKIAGYLQVHYKSGKQDGQLAEGLARKFPRLKKRSAIRLIKQKTGITRYHPPLREGTIRHVTAHARQILIAFNQAASKRIQPKNKIENVIRLLEKLGPIRIAGQKISLLNGLTPTLACLDPYRRFPILNQRTTKLLRRLGEKLDFSGAIALYKIIGLKGVKDAFTLDVYSNTILSPKTRRKKTFKRLFKNNNFRNVGLKHETQSTAKLKAREIKIRKAHNRLTNKFRKYLSKRQITVKEHRFDALVENQTGNRCLLIEAKTESGNSTGRTQIRQAIGQLFDYRREYFSGKLVDLAVLLPSRPPRKIQGLLKSLRINVLWFQGKDLRGSVKFKRKASTKSLNWTSRAITERVSLKVVRILSGIIFAGLGAYELSKLFTL